MATASNIPVDMSDALIFARLTDRSRKIINQAHKDAATRKHTHLYSDILLQCIAHEQGSVAWAALQNLDLLDPVLSHKHVPTDVSASDPSVIPLFRDVKNALEASGKIAISLGHPYIGVEHILLGLLEQPDCIAVSILEKHIKKETIRAEILDLLGCADPKEPIVPEGIKLGSRVQNRLYPHIQGTVVAMVTYLYGPAEIMVSVEMGGRIYEYKGPVEAFALLSTPKQGE